MKYRQLFSLQVQHDYYPDQACPDLHIAPDPACQRTLQGLRCVLQSMPGALRVMVPVSEQGTPLIALLEPTVLEFALQVQQERFFRFSDLSALAALAAPVFANSAASGALRLSDGASLPASASSRAPLARIRLTLGNPVSALDQNSHAFQVQLAAQAWPWHYYVLSSGQGSPTLTSRDPALVFDAHDLVAQPDPQDPLASQLLAQYPGQRLHRMRSQTALACQQAARKGLALSMDGEMVLNDLPNPPLENLLMMQDQAVPQQALYQIVKYLTP